MPELDVDVKDHVLMPGDLTVTGRQFDRMLGRSILPFLGINGTLAAVLWLADTDGTAALLLLVTIGSAVGLAVVLTRGLKGVYLGVATAGLLIGVVGLVPDGIRATALLGILGALALLVWRRPMSTASGAVLAAYYGFTTLVMLAGEDRMRVTILGVGLGALFFAFAHHRATGSALATLATGVVVGAAEFRQSEQNALLMVPLLITFGVLTAFFELRLRPPESSIVRLFARHGIAVALALLIGATLADGDRAVWIWAALSSVYQIAATAHNTAHVDTRVAWIAVVCAVAAWTVDVWQTSVLMMFALAVALRLVAVRTGNRFTADVSLGIALVAAFGTGASAFEGGGSVATLVTAALVTGVLLALAKPQSFPVDSRWWTGLVPTVSGEGLRTRVRALFQPLIESGLGAVIAGYVRAAWRWIAYFKGPNDPFQRDDLVTIVAHGLGALVFSDQLSIFAGAATSNAQFLALVAPGSLLLWGGLLAARGSRLDGPLERLIGLGLIGFVTLRWLGGWGAYDPVAAAATLLMIGMTIWLVALQMQAWPDSRSTPHDTA